MLERKVDTRLSKNKRLTQHHTQRKYMHLKSRHTFIKKEKIDTTPHTKKSICIWDDYYTLPLYSWSLRKSSKGCIFSFSCTKLVERCRLRNSKPFPMYFERVGGVENSENGSKSNSKIPSPPLQNTLIYCNQYI